MSHTIALVDDDQNILASVSMALEAEGFTVETYTGGVEALDALGRSPVDLAIVDIKMPRMDGMELLERWYGTWKPYRERAKRLYSIGPHRPGAVAPLLRVGGTPETTAHLET